MTSLPIVSVIILAWNSKAVLPTCLESLSGQFSDFEVILVDNGSQDDAPVDIKEKYAMLNLCVDRLDANRGFAAANNLDAYLACGQWLALLNADASPEPDWLEKLLRAAQQNPEYSLFASCQIQLNNPALLDGAGDAYHISGLSWRNGYNLPSERNELEQREVFSPCAAAALYLREEFLNAGGFDEDYFSYFEDVDLGFRLRLGGAKCLYVPDAVVR